MAYLLFSTSARRAAEEAEAATGGEDEAETASKLRHNDPMMTSMYVPSGETIPESNGNESNNDTKNGHIVNGAGQTVAPATTVAAAAVAAAPPIPNPVLKSVPGTSGLKCLEDPSFLFEESSPSSKPAAAAAAVPVGNQAAIQAPVVTSQPKKPTYRVLEDPFEDMQPPATLSSSSRKNTADPMMASMYDPTTSTEARVARQPAANEVLEGAREKFDKFWSKSPNATTAAAAPPPAAVAAPALPPQKQQQQQHQKEN